MREMASSLPLGFGICFLYECRSVGATVIEMLTGHPPYHDISPTPVILSVGTGKLTPLVDDRFSREAKAFLEQCFKR